MPIESITRAELNKADLLSLAYSSRSAPNSVIYVLVDRAVDISMLHDPRLCLLGEGGTTTGQQIVRLKSSNTGLDGAPAWILHTDNTDGAAVMLCMYHVSNKFLPTKDAVNAYTAKTRLADLARMATSPSRMNSIRDDARSRQVTWYRFVIYCDDAKQGSELLQRFAEQFINRVIGPDAGEAAVTSRQPG